MRTLVAYIDGVIIPYMDGVHDMLGVGGDNAALVIFDHFRGQLTPKITEILEDNNVQSVLVPSRCIDDSQPSDVSVNRFTKSFVRSEYQS